MYVTLPLVSGGDQDARRKSGKAATWRNLDAPKGMGRVVRLDEFSSGRNKGGEEHVVIPPAPHNAEKQPPQSDRPKTLATGPSRSLCKTEAVSGQAKSTTRSATTIHSPSTSASTVFRILASFLQKCSMHP